MATNSNNREMTVPKLPLNSTGIDRRQNKFRQIKQHLQKASYKNNSLKHTK